MEPDDPRAWRLNGAVPKERNGAYLEVQFDGQVVLYGLDDWDELRDEPVVRFVGEEADEEVGREDGEDQPGFGSGVRT